MLKPRTVQHNQYVVKNLVNEIHCKDTGDFLQRKYVQNRNNLIGEVENIFFFIILLVKQCNVSYMCT